MCTVSCDHLNFSDSYLEVGGTIPYNIHCFCKYLEKCKGRYQLGDLGIYNKNNKIMKNHCIGTYSGWVGGEDGHWTGNIAAASVGH
jgi:hypothetical protein